MTTTDYQAWTCPTCGKTATAGSLARADWERHRIKVQQLHREQHGDRSVHR